MALILVLISLRVMAPIWVRDYVENTLDRIEGYDSSIADVDLFLLRGGYQIEELHIVKTGGDVPVPFVSMPLINLSLQWSELFAGVMVGEVVFDRPVLNFVAGPTESQAQIGADASWVERAQELFPFKINRLETRGGEIHFRDFHSQPNVDVYLDQLDATAENLTNSEKLSGEMPARARAKARVARSGTLDFEIVLDPFAERPTFKSAMELEKLALPEVNDLLRAYANADAEGGTFAFYSEIQSDQGSYEGYVKPILEGTEILVWKQEEEGFWGKLWEGVVEVTAKILTNSSEDRVASKIPISGTIDSPNPDLWAAIGSLLRNAFVEALGHGIEGQFGKNLPDSFDLIDDSEGAPSGDESGD